MVNVGGEGVPRPAASPAERFEVAMVGRPDRTPRRAAYLAPLLALLLPVSAGAQTRYASFADGESGQPAAGQTDAGGVAGDDILNMDLEQLAKTPVVVPSMDIPVTSVTKQESTVGRSAAAVFVITNEMIRRSGATTIAEALRMAPGFEVAQVNSNTWAISARGINDPYALMLLVLIDGRTVYNPDFSGVFWDVQDVLLEDVERIEVIRGPGGTLWGANAVNGVVNIITKRAKDTQGAYLSAGGGTHERTLDGFRYGGRSGDDLYYRVYGKHFERGGNFDPAGLVDDAWRQGRFGFRADWEPCGGKTDVLTIQGDHYTGRTDNSVIPTSPEIPEHLTGENLLMRWRHIYDEDSDWTLQTYYDNYTRIDQMQTQIDRTFDIDFQYRFRLGERHGITCGAGFRNVVSYVAGGDTFTTYESTPYWTTNYTSQFVQDEITIVEDRLAFTLGCKLEQNPYTGLEYQPTARVLWTPDRKHTAWGAISRAVVTPNRLYDQSTITIQPISPNVYPRIYGDSDVRSMVLLAYEVGYRTQATERFSWDVAAFYNVYDSIISYTQGTPFVEIFPLPPHLIVPAHVANDGFGDTYGVELAANYAVSERWRLYAQYTLLQEHLLQRIPDGSSQPLLFSDPCNQVYLRSSWDLGEGWEFDLMARYVDRLIGYAVPNYISMDLRLAWRPRKHLELAVVGQNLLQEHHWERGSRYAYATEVPRGVYGTLTWRR